MTREGVTFVVPVHNGERWLHEVLKAIVRQCDGRPHEIVAVDDGSTDGSPAILESWRRRGVRVVTIAAGSHPGALNAGIHAARHPVVCLIDQDVVVQPGWLSRIAQCFDGPRVAAVQGAYRAAPSAPLVARVMGLDLEERYAAIEGPMTGHVCTGNAAYRLEALGQVGPFDESFGYGADNDMSYRLAAAGYELRICHGATAVHYWRESLWGYLRQQYGFGYGRLDLVAKHPRHASGDAVSPAAMMAHAPVMLAAVVAGAAWLVSRAWGGPSFAAGSVALLLVAVLAAERLVAGVRAALRHRDSAGLWFPAFHLLRDVAWALAIVVWAGRRLAGRSRRSTHSMARGSPK